MSFFVAGTGGQRFPNASSPFLSDGGTQKLRLVPVRNELEQDRALCVSPVV